MIVLGIDPGTHKTGYGLIDFSQGKCKALDWGVIRTDSKLQLTDRLQNIYIKLEEIIAEWAPDLVCIEDIFVKDNIRSALLLGHARGVAIAACSKNKNISIVEYSPREIKKALVGKGSASKEQVLMMVKLLLKLTNDTIAEDASDALAAAVCAANNNIQKERYV